MNEIKNHPPELNTMKHSATILLVLFFTALPLIAQPAMNDATVEHSLSLRASAIKTIGHFSDQWEKGNGFYASYMSLYDDNWAFVLQSGYITFTYREGAGYGGDPKFSIIPLQVGGRYYFLTGWLRPFLSAMSGANIVSREYIRYGVGEIDMVDKTSVHLNFQVGGGLGLQFTDNLGIDVTFHYNSHLLEPGVPYNITGLETAAALSWTWNSM